MGLALPHIFLWGDFMTKHIFAGLLAGASLFSVTAHAENYAASAPIEKVVIYRDGGATITRRGTVHLPVGQHTITVGRLPDFLDDEDAPAANLPTATTHLNGLTLTAGYSDRPASAQQDTLNKQIREIDQQLKGLKNKVQARNMQLAFIRSLNKRQEDGGDAVMAVEDWDKALGFIGEQSTALLDTIQQLNFDHAELVKKRKALKRELLATGAARQDYTKATLSVENTAEGDVTFELTYFVQDAKWALDVAARLDTSGNKLSVRSGAVISQDSGEDWANVSLALSNNRPSGNLGGIYQEPHILTLVDPSRYRRNFNESVSQGDRARLDQPNLEEIIVTGTKRTEHKSTQFDRLYEISGKSSIPSTDEKKHVSLDHTESDAVLVVRANPSADRTAYLFVDTRFKGFGGARHVEATLNRDGHYVGRGNWPDLENETDLKLPYGADPAIDITYIEQAPEDGDTGFINRSDVKESRYLITATNYHSEAATVEIFDQVPVAGHEDIKVRILDGATRPTEKDMDGKEGLMMWRKTLAPGETWEIKHRYRITYPSGSALGRKP